MEVDNNFTFDIVCNTVYTSTATNMEMV